MCAIAQCHKANHTYVCTYLAHNCCVHLCAQEKKIKTGSKFGLLFEVIFKDLAVPSCNCKANVRKLVCPSCGHVLLILGSGGKLCSGPQTPPTLTIDTMLPAMWLGSRTFCIIVYMHQSIVHDSSLHSSQFCSLLELYILLIN